MMCLFVVPIDVEHLEDFFKTPIDIMVRPMSLIRVLHDTIAQELCHTHLGKHYQSPLEILPLKMVPTLEYLKGQDLAELRKDARKPDGLPGIPVGEFFGPQVSRGVHFLVWLPPRDREFLWSVLFHD
jgi:hypothetical protein